MANVNPSTNTVVMESVEDALKELEIAIHGFSCYAKVLSEFVHGGGQQDLVYGCVFALTSISDEVSVAHTRVKAAIKESMQ